MLFRSGSGYRTKNHQAREEGGPPSSKGNTLERSQSSGMDMLLQEVQDLREGQTRLEESLEGLKNHYQRDYTVIMQALQEERFRYTQLTLVAGVSSYDNIIFLLFIFALHLSCRVMKPLEIGRASCRERVSSPV